MSQVLRRGPLWALDVSLAGPMSQTCMCKCCGPSTLPSERHGRHRTQAPLRPTGRVPLAPAPPTPQRHVAAGLSNEMRWPARGSSCGDQGNQERAGDGDRGDRRGQSNDEAQLEESRQKKELGETQAGGRDHKGEDGTDPDA